LNCARTDIYLFNTKKTHGHLYSFYTFFFQHTTGVHEESLQRIFMSSYRSPSRNWTVQELIFICLLIQRKRTAICILYTHSSFNTLLVSMKNLYKEYLWVLTGHHHEIELCKKLYLFVCDTWTRENKRLYILLSTHYWCPRRIFIYKEYLWVLSYRSQLLLTINFCSHATVAHNQLLLTLNYYYSSHSKIIQDQLSLTLIYYSLSNITHIKILFTLNFCLHATQIWLIFNLKNFSWNQDNRCGNDFHTIVGESLSSLFEYNYQFLHGEFKIYKMFFYVSNG